MCALLPFSPNREILLNSLVWWLVVGGLVVVGLLGLVWVVVWFGGYFVVFSFFFKHEMTKLSLEVARENVWFLFLFEGKGAV